MTLNLTQSLILNLTNHDPKVYSRRSAGEYFTQLFAPLVNHDCDDRDQWKGVHQTEM